jgi:hypothetical protein
MENFEAWGKAPVYELLYLKNFNLPRLTLLLYHILSKKAISGLCFEKPREKPQPMI